MEKLKNISVLEMMKELNSRGYYFPTLTSVKKYYSPTNFLDIPLEIIAGCIYRDREVGEDFFDEKFITIYNSIDWNDLRNNAIFCAIDYIVYEFKERYGILLFQDENECTEETDL